MIKFLFEILLLTAAWVMQVPKVKVAGAMKNIMMHGDLSAHVNIDTLEKTNLYGLGPVAGLKGEIMIVDGQVFTTSVEDKKLVNQQTKISASAMLVYSHVKKWKPVDVQANIRSYAELETLIETTARSHGYDIDIPFAFKIEMKPAKASYHVIDWKEGTDHTMENHKQFSIRGTITNDPCTMLGFYSRHHKSIFTHHTTFMHVHVLEGSTKTVGHLDELLVMGKITVYLPE